MTTNEQTSEHMKDETQKKSSNLWIKIVVGVLVIALLGYSIYGFIAPKQSARLPDLTLEDTKEPRAGQIVDAELENGVQVVHLSWGKLNYDPDTIRVKQGIPVKIVGDMERLSGCFRSLIISDLGVTATMTEANNVIEFTPQKSGTFPFTCAMGMGHGDLIVA